MTATGPDILRDVKTLKDEILSIADTLIMRFGLQHMTVIQVSGGECGVKVAIWPRRDTPPLSPGIVKRGVWGSFKGNEHRIYRRARSERMGLSMENLCPRSISEALNI